MSSLLKFYYRVGLQFQEITLRLLYDTVYGTNLGCLGYSDMVRGQLPHLVVPWIRRYTLRFHTASNGDLISN